MACNSQKPFLKYYSRFVTIATNYENLGAAGFEKRLKN